MLPGKNNKMNSHPYGVGLNMTTPLSMPRSNFLLTQTTNSAPFPISERVLELRNAFFDHLRRNEAQESFNQALDRLGDANPTAKLRMLGNWSSAFIAQRDEHWTSEFTDELAVKLLTRTKYPSRSA